MMQLFPSISKQRKYWTQDNEAKALKEKMN